MNLKPLENILWKTPEGIACKKAIIWCDKNFPNMSVSKQMDYCDKFEKKFDEPLNKRWAQLKKQYKMGETL